MFNVLVSVNGDAVKWNSSSNCNIL